MTTRTRVLTITALLLVAALVIVGARELLRPPEFALPERDPEGRNESNHLSMISVERPLSPAQGFVGSTVCRDCHDGICDTFQMHSMGRATARIDEVAPIEEYGFDAGFSAPPSRHRPFDVRYYASRDDGHVYHHERATAPDGTLLYDQAVPVDYEVGSGVRGRSYITNRDGVLLMSPMSWYSGSERWDFSPGYQIQNKHFERRILGGCIHCHVGQLDPVEGLLNQFDPQRPVLESAISCERCHGPGEQHVAFRLGQLASDSEDAIVNPSRLEPHLRDSVCYQCHLHGVHRMLRYGRDEYDFRPGDDICDIWAVFVDGTGIEDNSTTEAVSQTEQMLSSVCYEKSAGRLGCASCHDPHALPGESQRIDYYRARCLDCHAESDPPCSQPLSERLLITAEDSCIVCHMPSVAASDVPHTSQTDHRVLRIPKESTPHTGESLVEIFREETGVIPEAELARARALFLVLQAERSNNPAMALEAVEILENWLVAAPDDLPAIETLGIALLMGEEVQSAVEVWERGLALDPDNEDLLSRLMTTCQDHGQTDLGLMYGERFVEVNPCYHDYWGRLAHLLGQKGRFEEGIVAAERALEIRPSSATIHGWLSEAYEIVGDSEKAAEHRRMYEYLTLD